MPEESQQPEKRPVPPLPPFAPLPPLPQRGAAPEGERPRDAHPGGTDYDRKLAELEKRLQEEREKLLRANLKSQEEAAAAARVEVSLKELQDRLRRERRDQEQEESRLKLEAKLHEMEGRLAQERAPWVSTLNSQ